MANLADVSQASHLRRTAVVEYVAMLAKEFKAAGADTYALRVFSLLPEVRRCR